jgi:hypothetical protein
MTDTPILTIHRLPPRPTQLSDDTLSDVFGGCIQDGDSCANLDPSDNCCPGLGCLPDGVVCGEVD